jgi:LPXTG-motif cell wall-anchored protein
VTSHLIPPLVDSGQPAEVGDAAQVSRSGSGSGSSSRSTASAATLPLTGSGTFAVFAAGLAALAIGALALWWGSRNRPEVDATEPGTTG